MTGVGWTCRDVDARAKEVFPVPHRRMFVWSSRGRCTDGHWTSLDAFDRHINNGNEESDLNTRHPEWIQMLPLSVYPVVSGKKVNAPDRLAKAIWTDRDWYEIRMSTRVLTRWEKIDSRLKILARPKVPILLETVQTTLPSARITNIATKLALHALLSSDPRDEGPPLVDLLVSYRQPVPGVPDLESEDSLGEMITLPGRQVKPTELRPKMQMAFNNNRIRELHCNEWRVYYLDDFRRVRVLRGIGDVFSGEADGNKLILRKVPDIYAELKKYKDYWPNPNLAFGFGYVEGTNFIVLHTGSSKITELRGRRLRVMVFFQIMQMKDALLELGCHAQKHGWLWKTFFNMLFWEEDGRLILDIPLLEAKGMVTRGKVVSF
ncbi:hypothetical protein B0H13DRAFT_1862828 [Mycena leptocephala]|nr:hypothetical protein B0H13DRAFT_1862828 [Mycena leptocephala]